MDKSSKSRNLSVNKRDAVPNAKKQHKPKNTKKQGKESQSTISIHKNSDSIENVQVKPCNNAVQIKTHDAKIEISMKSLDEGTLAKSSYLMDQEIKMRTVITVQDKYRLRIPEPKNVIQKICRECKFYCLREPRITKPIIILDLDTLKIRNPEHAPSTTPTMVTLLEFLYYHFDIAVWSSLQMCDAIPKLEKFGFFNKLNKFFINFVLDKTAMNAVYHPITDYVMVKDLKVIWNIYPQYNDYNCVMINNHLKKIIYKYYGVPLGLSKMDRLVDEVTMTVILEFLIETLNSKHSLANLNTPIWKQIKD